MHPLLSIVLGGLFAGVVAFLLGFAVLRLRKIYFSITTLALTSVFAVVIRNLPRLTGGASGMVLPSALFSGDAAKNYWMVFALALGVIAVSYTHLDVYKRQMSCIVSGSTSIIPS